MVLHKYGDRLYSGVAAALTRQLQAVAARLEAQQGGEALLKELKARWDDHVKATQMVRDILMYMDRTYVAQQHRTPVFQLGLDLWRDHVARHPVIQQRALATLSDLIARERAGEVIERSLVRAATQMLVDLGAGVYEADFERPFLAATADFYRREAQRLMASCDCPGYLERAERRLAEEADRVKLYLDASTGPKVARVVEHELIREQMRALVEMEGSGLVAMLEGDRYADLARMHALLRRVPDGGPQLMRQALGDHVRAAGKALVSDPERQRDPVAWVSRLLEERDKYEAIVARGLGDDRAFRCACFFCCWWGREGAILSTAALYTQQSKKHKKTNQTTKSSTTPTSTPPTKQQHISPKNTATRSTRRSSTSSTSARARPSSSPCSSTTACARASRARPPTPTSRPSWTRRWRSSATCRRRTCLRSTTSSTWRSGCSAAAPFRTTPSAACSSSSRPSAATSSRRSSSRCSPTSARAGEVAMGGG